MAPFVLTLSIKTIILELTQLMSPGNFFLSMFSFEIHQLGKEFCPQRETN